MTVTAIPETTELDRIAAEVDRAIKAVQELPADAAARATAMKDAIEAFHKIGLTRIIQQLKAHASGREILFEMVDDPAIYALFTMHGLIREDIGARLTRVLDTVRPYMQSHGGDVELVRVEDATAFIRLSGACNGCSMSAVTLRNTVEEAIHEHLPEIRAVEVVPSDPEAAEPAKAVTGFVNIDTLQPLPVVAEGWAVGPLEREVPEAMPYRWDADGASVLILRLRGELRAWRNECAHLGMPLDGGTLDAETCVLTCPWHGFRFDGATGECLTVPEAQLEGLPLRVEQGRIIVRTAA